MYKIFTQSAVGGIPVLWKRRLLMRLNLVFILLTLTFVQVSATTFGQRVTLAAEGMKVEALLAEIEAQTGYRILYNTKTLTGLPLMGIAVQEATIKETLDRLFYKQPITYTIQKKTIVLKESTFLTDFTPVNIREITGKVTGAEGESLPGVNVVEKGTVNGTVTDLDGNYKLDVEEGATLVFSFIGYKTVEAPVTASAVMNMTMEEDVTSLDEMVITGIVERRAESYTGSVVTLKSDDLQRVANTNIFQSLKNLDPSLNLVTDLSLGSDPNRLPDIQIRGTSTFPSSEDANDLRGNYQASPNQPLFILDGFEASITTVFDLDMDRVNSVTILKDASAKALYGSKAANGVVVIETKRPKAGTIRVRYSGNVNIQAPDLSSYNLTNAREKLEVEKRAGDWDFRQAIGDVRLENEYNELLKKVLEGDDTYWLSKPTQVGIGTKHTISFELGEQKTRVMADMSYNDVRGVMKESGRKNISGSISVDYRHKNLLFRNTMSVNSNSSEDSPYGSFDDYAKMNPYWDAYNPDGTVKTDGNYTNPLFNATINTSLRDSYFEFTNNADVEWTIVEGLKLKTRVGVTNRTSEAHRFYPANHTKFDNYTDADFARKGSYQLNNGSSFTLAGDMNLQYSTTINKKHFLMSNIGFNVSSRLNDEVVTYAEGFPSDRMNDITFALQYAEGRTPYGAENNVRDIGLLGVFAYSYDDRFLSDVTIRQTASSLFGSDDRWGTFYSVGLGWNLHKEAFFKDIARLDQFKVRTSIGTSGNQNFSSYQALSTYSYYLDATYGGELGAYVKSLANSELQWQTKKDFNAGFDLRRGRLSLTFDYYQSITENLITNLSISNSTGFSTIKENIGKVKNEGFELAASYQVLRSDDGFLNFTFAGTTNENTILGLSDAMKEFNKAQDELASERTYGKSVLKYVEGGSMNSIWAVPSLGIDPATGRELFVKQDGSITYTWDALDQVVAGNDLPKYRGNVGVNGEYKGFGLSVVATFLGGSQLYNSTLVNKVENIDTEWNVDRRVFEGRWTTPGQHAPYQILARFYNSEISAWQSPRTNATTRFVQDRNELTISSVSVYYNVKREWAKKLGMSDLKFSAYMNDVYTYSTIVIERGTSYPYARTISLSLRATF